MSGTSGSFPRGALRFRIPSGGEDSDTIPHRTFPADRSDTVMSAAPAGRLEQLANLLLRHRVALLVTVLVVTLLSYVKASQLTLEQSIESLYALDDPHLLDYLDSKSLFGGDEFVIVAYSDPQLLSPEGLERLRKFSAELSAVPGVQSESTQNLAEALYPRQIPFLLRPLFTRRRDEMVELSRSMLVGADDQTTGIVLRLKPEESTDARAETFRRVRELADAHQPPAFVVGEPVQVHDMFRYVEEDGELLFLCSLVLLGLVLFALFRSLRWVLLALVLVAATVTWTKAILAVCGMRLSMVSSMLNSLVTIIGIATVTHVMVHYRKRRLTLGPVDAFRRTFVELSPAIFWTTLTTAAGFGSLLSSPITPVRSFGTMTMLGTLLILLSTSTLLPGGILSGRRTAELSSSAAERPLVGFLSRLIDLVERRTLPLGIAVFGLFGFGVAGLFRLDVETDFSRNFRVSSPIVRSLDFVETRLGGAGTWEVNFPAPHELTPEYLDRVRTLARELRNLDVEGSGKPGLTKVVAMTDLLDLVPGQSNDVDAVNRKLALINAMQPEFESSLYNAERGRMRLVLRAKERQPSETKLRLIERVGELARREFSESRTTGIFVLLAYLIENLLRGQLVSFAWSAAMVGGMMTIAFRSLRIGLVSLLPNVLPIALVVGTMGWIGVAINIGTAMIASVSMGLTIDASIHYLSGYRAARAAGMPFGEALRETHKGVGLALVFGTLALVVGFSVLSLSHFIPLVYFGVLVSLAMFGGLVGNLVLLPLLLHWVDRGSD